MKDKFENGACLTSVLRPTSGVSVAFFGSRTDLQTAFRSLCSDLISSGSLSYSDLNSALKSSFLTASVLPPRK